MRRSLSVLLCALALVGVFGMSAEAQASSNRAGIVTVSSGRLYVRSAPSTGSSVVASLAKGSYVTLVFKSGDWWKVEYAGGKYGYCHGAYLTLVSGSPVTVTTQSGRLNVRSGPGTSYARTGSLQKGQRVMVLSSANGWSRILYSGTKTGYVSAQYLSVTYGAVSMNVPSFKQTDSRWANVPVGESGKPMSQIGCATTAVAMMESFRTGTNIYPDAMMRKLKYTPSGDLYWPGDYITVTDGSGHLSGIYARLKQGKPVLFGARNAYGKQHWVVIRGFSGGNSLTAAGFSIHDPGSASRVTLQQFLDAYPTFYKYFYYP